MSERPEAAPANRRKEVARIDTWQPAELITHDGRSICIDLLDISRAGFKIKHQDELLDGDYVTIISARGSKVLAKILWVADQMAGGIFVDPPEDLQ